LQAAALVLSIIKAVPYFEKMFSQCIQLYYASVNAADESRVLALEKKREVILKSLKYEALTDENRNSLRRILYDISRG
jgi:hypothetical protein